MHQEPELAAVSAVDVWYGFKGVALAGAALALWWYLARTAPKRR